MRIVRQRLELLWLLWLRSYWGSAAVSRCVRAVAGTAPACAARPRRQCLTRDLTRPCAAASASAALRSATWTRADCCCAPTRTTLSGRFGSSQSASITRPSPPHRCKGSRPSTPAGYSQTAGGHFAREHPRSAAGAVLGDAAARARQLCAARARTLWRARGLDRAPRAGLRTLSAHVGCSGHDTESGRPRLRSAVRTDPSTANAVEFCVMTRIRARCVGLVTDCQ